MKWIMTCFICIAFFSCKVEKTESIEAVKDIAETEVVKPATNIEVNPISHATAVINWKDRTIYLDPTGGAKAFEDFERPNFVLLTDIHGDHLDFETLQALQLKEIPIIAPQAVKDKLPKELQENVLVMENKDVIEEQGVKIEAIPMYNLREEAKQFHPRGRGNGYVLSRDGEKLYIAGDTEDIPEMRNLKNIDVALIPMNLPYTMPVDAAADAVLDFEPKMVIPYHYRGKKGFADVEKFKQLVNSENEKINVVLKDWYPGE